MDWVKFGMMKAEFEEACAAIDQRAADVALNCLRSGFAALLGGDVEKRDRICQSADTIPGAVDAAKMEAWYRIGEKHGLSRDQAAILLQRIGH